MYPVSPIVGDKITFIFDDNTVFCGKVHKSGARKYYLHFNEPIENDIIFKKLGIKSARDFVSEILKYEVHGCFPEVLSIEDLRKVLKALYTYNTNFPNLPVKRKIVIPEPQFTDISNMITIIKPKKINLKFEL